MANQLAFLLRGGSVWSEVRCSKPLVHGHRRHHLQQKPAKTKGPKTSREDPQPRPKGRRRAKQTHSQDPRTKNEPAQNEPRPKQTPARQFAKRNYKFVFIHTIYYELYNSGLSMTNLVDSMFETSLSI